MKHLHALQRTSRHGRQRERLKGLLLKQSSRTTVDSQTWAVAADVLSSLSHAALQEPFTSTGWFSRRRAPHPSALPLAEAAVRAVTQPEFVDALSAPAAAKQIDALVNVGSRGGHWRQPKLPRDEVERLSKFPTLLPSAADAVNLLQSSPLQLAQRTHLSRDELLVAARAYRQLSLALDAQGTPEASAEAEKAMDLMRQLVARASSDVFAGR